MFCCKLNFSSAKHVWALLLFLAIFFIFIYLNLEKEYFIFFKENMQVNYLEVEKEITASNVKLSVEIRNLRVNGRKVEKNTISATVRLPTETPQCYKKHQNQTYKICKELPYSEVKCGPKYSQNKTKQDEPYVVPDVIFYIWFGAGRKFQYYNYLSIRSAAVVHQPERIDFYHENSLPVGKYWERAIAEIPCLNLVQTEMPRKLGNTSVPGNVQRTDVARLQILIKHGGIYLDGDIILFKNLDRFRIYPASLGRSTQSNVCICMAIARKNSLFIREYYKHAENIIPQYKNAQAALFTLALGKFVLTTKYQVHLEETALSRPNPYVLQDGPLGTTLRRIDMTENYLLHIHPQCSLLRNAIDRNWTNWEEDTLRKLDGVYGEGARIALFGSPDLIYKPGEEVHEMQEKVKLFKFPPMVQKNAVIKDKGD